LTSFEAVSWTGDKAKENLAVAWTMPGKDKSRPTEVIQGKNLTPAKGRNFFGTPPSWWHPF
jgi:hypothetical protein